MESNGFNHFVPVVKRSSAYELVESNVQQMLGLANKKKNKQTVCHIDLTAVTVIFVKMPLVRIWNLKP